MIASLLSQKNGNCGYSLVKQMIGQIALGVIFRSLLIVGIAIWLATRRIE